MYVHNIMCICCICIFSMTVYSALRIPLVSNCAIQTRFIIIKRRWLLAWQTTEISCMFLVTLCLYINTSLVCLSEAVSQLGAFAHSLPLRTIQACSQEVIYSSWLCRLQPSGGWFAIPMQSSWSQSLKWSWSGCMTTLYIKSMSAQVTHFTQIVSFLAPHSEG